MKKVLSVILCVVTAVSCLSFSASAKAVKVTAPKIKMVKNINKTTQKIKWSKVKKASGYQLYYKVSGGKFKKLKTFGKNTNSYQIKNLKTNKKYFYKVRAYKKKGGNKYYSKFSPEIGKMVKGPLADPVKLASLKPYVSREAYTTTSSEKDVFGNYYNTSLKGVAAIGSKEDAYATYRIDSKYSKFTGTIFLTSSSYNTDVSRRSVKIYGDNVLLYSKSIACGEDSIPFSVNITGVRDLKIVMEKNNMCKTYIGNPMLIP